MASSPSINYTSFFFFFNRRRFLHSTGTIRRSSNFAGIRLHSLPCLIKLDSDLLPLSDLSGAGGKSSRRNFSPTAGFPGSVSPWNRKQSKAQELLENESPSRFQEASQEEVIVQCSLVDSLWDRGAGIHRGFDQGEPD